VEIVDMREELRDGNDLSLSIPLLDAIRKTADEKKQAILFLNRRGNSRALVCVDCRQAPECPRCNARLTYHSANERLMCHYCGFSQHVPPVCPTCGGTMKRVGVGTQKVQLELEEMIPQIQVSRMDADTVSAVNTHEKILEQFQKDNTPVLIGTQMVAKGLNLPNVTLVGVLDADLSLYNDSFRAAETTFNLLTQVVGRAGRGETSGRAMIQTMVPGHRVIELAAKQDYDAFYELEIGLRRVQGLPPFGDITQITFTGQDEAAVLRGAAKFRESLKHCLQDPAYGAKDVSVLGPAPCPVPKINYNFRYRITLRCPMDRNKRVLLAHLLRQFTLDRENRGISAFADVNGFD
jgi:primosomal protein N' (replication factor Y)